MNDNCAQKSGRKIILKLAQENISFITANRKKSTPKLPLCVDHIRFLRLVPDTGGVVPGTDYDILSRVHVKSYISQFF